MTESARDPRTRVTLRDVEDGDLQVFFEHQLDPEATRMAGFPARDRKGFLAHWDKILGDESVVTKTILFQGEVAGCIVSFVQAGEREVGYWIGREYWGKGVATRALSALLDLEKRRPLYAYVARHNAASIKVLKNCGFRASGENPEEFIFELLANHGGLESKNAR